jgi:hypothetical protein
MLDIKLKRQLVDALLNCPSISDQETRKYLIKDMPDDIKDTIDRHSNNRVDIANIVNRCLDFPTGIEKLIDIVRMYEGDSEPMRKIYDIIPTMLCLDSPISEQYLSELFFILGKNPVPFNVLQAYYQTSLPPFFSIQSEPQSTWQIIAVLSNIPIQTDKTQPLIHFVQRIADHLSSDKETGLLTDWICRVATDFGLVNEKEEPSETCDHEIDSRPIFLLVHLISDPNNRNNKHQEFAVHIYAWQTPDDVPCIFTQGKCNQNEILDIIDNVIDSKFNENDDIRAIEFILPCELILLNVNEWERNDDIEWDSRLIDDYQVVVRLDRFHYQGRRLSKRHLRDRWKKQWNRFKAMNNNCCVNTSIYWECDHEKYDARKLCSGFTDNADKTCLMQTFSPQQPIEFGRAILNAGIPVAVWCKKYGHQKNEHEMIKNDLLKLIKDGNLLMLPDRIHKVCQKPEEKKRLQDHLTLLWDDPGKLPKDLQNIST